MVMNLLIYIITFFSLFSCNETENRSIYTNNDLNKTNNELNKKVNFNGEFKTMNENINKNTFEIKEIKLIIEIIQTVR